MNLTEAGILGVVQGLTEFLPVSSSGHLRLFEIFFHGVPQSLAFDVALHLGTLAAVFFFYRHDLIEILKGCFDSEKPEARQFVLGVIVASVPTAILGLGFKKGVGMENLGLKVVGAGLLVSAIANWTTGLSREEKPFSLKGALLVGLIQGFAVLPGISRSGSTIATGLALGWRPEFAARFSFLASIPAISGAALLTFKDAYEASDPGLAWDTTLLGMFLSATVGWFALSFLIRQLKTASFRPWAIYCLLLGTLALVQGFRMAGA